MQKLSHKYAVSQGLHGITSQASQPVASAHEWAYHRAMDFQSVLKTLLRELDAAGIRYAVIGGFALGLLGVPRATQDLDLLVHRDDMGRLHGLLERLGYERHAQWDRVQEFYDLFERSDAGRQLRQRFEHAQ